MPVSPFSRYRALETLDINHARRGMTRSLPIRRLPMSPPPARRQHRFASYETADLLALKYWRREDLYWHLLDANRTWEVTLAPAADSAAIAIEEHNIRLPDDLRPGEVLDIPPLNFATRIERRIL